jgi:hypothetical protein
VSIWIAAAGLSLGSQDPNEHMIHAIVRTIDPSSHELKPMGKSQQKLGGLMAAQFEFSAFMLVVGVG